MSTERVKIYKASSPESLESKINCFLAERSYVKLVGVSITSSDVDEDYIACITYQITGDK